MLRSEEYFFKDQRYGSMVSAVEKLMNIMFPGIPGILGGTLDASWPTRVWICIWIWIGEDSS